MQPPAERWLRAVATAPLLPVLVAEGDDLVLLGRRMLVAEGDQVLLGRQGWSLRALPRWLALEGLP